MILKVSQIVATSVYSYSNLFQNSPKSHRSVLDNTFISKYVEKNFQKSPNLVTLSYFNCNLKKSIVTLSTHCFLFVLPCPMISFLLLKMNKVQLINFAQKQPESAYFVCGVIILCKNLKCSKPLIKFYRIQLQLPREKLHWPIGYELVCFEKVSFPNDKMSLKNLCLLLVFETRPALISLYCLTHSRFSLSFRSNLCFFL